jgi:uncharacterized protein DUF3606
MEDESIATSAPDHSSPDFKDARVSFGDLEQIKKWAVKLGTSPERLRNLIAQVGSRLEDLRQRLREPQSDD